MKRNGQNKAVLLQYFHFNYSSFYFVVFGSVCNKEVIRFGMTKYAQVLKRHILRDFSIFFIEITYKSILNL